MHNRFFAIAIFLLSTVGLFGQTDQNISVSFNNTPLTEAVLKLETLSNKKFYFDESWLKGHFVTNTFEKEPLRKVLEGIFSNTNINFVLKDGNVILLNNTYIYTELPSDYFNEAKPHDKVFFKKNIPNAKPFNKENW
jgi:type II secretory pathway component GspD/PulD (secretin)